MNTDAGCPACHKLGTAAGTPENNSPFSGLHASHLDPAGKVKATCIECHNMANATTGAGNHFKFLGTPQMEGPASQTVEPGGSAANYNATNQTCTVNCHTVQHTSFSWQGGANHAVPFLATGHTTVAQAGFDANCATCHAVTGSSPDASAPSCTVCHTSATALPFTNCISCHVKPPAGTTYPDIAGKHAKHDALATITGVCGPCHTGPGHREPGALRPRERAAGEERAARRARGRGVPVHLQRKGGGRFLQQHRPHLRQRELPWRRRRAQLADRDHRQRHGRRVPVVPQAGHGAGDPGEQQPLLRDARAST